MAILRCGDVTYEYGEEGCDAAKNRSLWEYFSDVSGRIKPTFVEIELGRWKAVNRCTQRKLVI